jgi:hypothetical protein
MHAALLDRIGYRALACALTFGALAPACASAQGTRHSARCLDEATGALSACIVDSLPVAAGSRRVPQYMLLLDEAKIPDTVVADYVVSTSGSAIGINAVSLRPGHASFTKSVVDALTATMFRPAERDGRRVAVAVRERFIFQPADDGTPHVPTELVELPGDSGMKQFVVTRQRRQPDARWRGDRDAAAAAALREVLKSMRTTVAVCIGLAEQPAREISASAVMVPIAGLRIVPMAECPPTLDSMIRQPVDARPPGHVDPFRVAIAQTYAWTRDSWILDIDVGQGLGHRRHTCTVDVSLAVKCVQGRSVVH